MNKQKHFPVLFDFFSFGAQTAQAQVKIGNNPTSVARNLVNGVYNVLVTDEMGIQSSNQPLTFKALSI